MGEFVEVLISFIGFDHVLNSRHQCVKHWYSHGRIGGEGPGGRSPFCPVIFFFSKRVSDSTLSFVTKYIFFNKHCK